MDVKKLILQEFLKRIDLETICQDEEVLVKAFEKVLGNYVDAREFVKELKQAYFDKLYEEFVEAVERVKTKPHEEPEEVKKVEVPTKTEEVHEEVEYDVLTAIFFVESAIKKPVPLDILEKVLPKLDVSTENLDEVLKALEGENLIKTSDGSITVTKEGKAKVHELNPSEKIQEWKEIVASDENLKQLLSEQKRKITTLGV